MPPNPFDDAEIRAGALQRARVGEHALQRRVPTGKENRHPEAEDLAQMPRRDLEELFAGLRQSELSADRVETGGPPLALARTIGLIADPLREMADDDSDEEHHR